MASVSMRLVVAAARPMADVNDAVRARQIAGAARRVAVVGIRPDSLTDRAATFVPAALAADGVAIVPVPIPPGEATSYLGAAPVSLADLARGPRVDAVVIFKRPADLPPAASIIACAPGAVWLQSGIRRPEWEAEVAAAGIPVVADRCIKVDRAAAKAARL